MRSWLLFICVFFSFGLKCQNELTNWYFGTNAGLSFASGSPMPLTNGALVTTEGCASVSDQFGNILFYTDGITIWNRNHAVMTNGNALMGDASSTQSAIIVKQPNTSNLFFVFTADNDAGINGIRYSIVDLTLSSGLGSVTSKNVLLHAPSCEKLCAVIACNNEDIWVVSHDWNSNNFRCWLVNSSGINLSPVVSSCGVTPSGITQSSYGQLKSNPEGNKIVACYYGFSGSGTNRMEVYNFNNQTGVVSNPVTLASDVGLYGCEFSSNGNLVYGSTNGGLLLQFNLCLANTAAIQASRYIVSNAGPFIGSLQLGPDGKIYVSRNSTALSVINNPNSIGVSCGYVNAAIPLAGRSSRMGLPNYPSYYSKARDDFTYTINCQAIVLNSIVNALTNCGTSNSTQIEWWFGDGNYASGSTVSHQFATPGVFTITMQVTHLCTVETVYKTVTTNSSSISIFTNISQP